MTEIQQLDKSLDHLIDTALRVKADRDEYRNLLVRVLQGATAHRWHCNSDEPNLFAEIKESLARTA